MKGVPVFLAVDMPVWAAAADCHLVLIALIIQAMVVAKLQVHTLFIIGFGDAMGIATIVSFMHVQLLILLLLQLGQKQMMLAIGTGIAQAIRME
ncbi:MAG TPA: hypothetical protein PK333_00875 [Candidatus Moranbacteria bacterium]|nr:hypothetical protein [Candidatus Moranbacteria bacterium]